MLRLIRGLWRTFRSVLDHSLRLTDLEAEMERLRELVEAHELAWTEQYDKLVRLYQRNTARLRSAAAALEEQTPPSVTDIRAQRALRKAELRQRRTYGHSE